MGSMIDPVHCTVRYTSLDRVVEMVSKLGKRAEIDVIDIKNAFRLLMVFPGDFDLLGLKIDDKYYIDKCLPMGCSISCNLFEKKFG
jgi:Na+-translocating ferredoxin:NAD+ oxidoreductase RnfE subunit